MLSIVIPIYNEESVLPELLARIAAAGVGWGEYEVIFVDDGSVDGSSSFLKEALSKNSRLRLLSLSRNFGHQASVTAGLEHVQGDVVVVMDGDLQDPPEVLGRFLEKWREGYSVVYAVREARKEGIVKRAMYALFYRVLRVMARVDIPLDAGDFCLMDIKVVGVINSMPERNRFVRGLRSWAGFRSVGLPYQRDARVSGVSKYSMRMLFRLAFDGITGFTTIPLKLATYLGFFISGLSLLASIFFVILKLAGEVAISGWTSLILAISFMGGVQLSVLGVMGEYIGRIYTEVQNRPVYIVKDKLGFGK